MVCIRSKAQKCARGPQIPKIENNRIEVGRLKCLNGQKNFSILCVLAIKLNYYADSCSPMAGWLAG